MARKNQRTTPCVSGLQCAVIVLLAPLFSCVGCKKEAAPISAATSKYEVADSAGGPDAHADGPSNSPGAAGRDANNDRNAPATDRSGSTAPSETPGAGSRRPGTESAGATSDSGSSRPNTPSSPDASPPGASPPRNTTRDSATPGNSAPIQPPPRTREQLENLEPPDGPPEAIWAFIEGLDRRAPRGTTRQEMMQDVQNILSARILAAQRLVQDKKADLKLRKNGVDVVLSSLQYMRDLGGKDVQRQVREFCLSLQGDPEPDIALTGRMMVFSLDVGELVDGKQDQAEPLLAAALKLLAEEEKSETVFEYLRTAALGMMEAGHRDAGRTLVDAVGEAFAGHADPRLSRQVKLFREEAQFLELELNKKIQAFADAKPDSLAPLADAAALLLDKPDIGLGTLQQSAFIADAMERRGEIGAAKTIYARIATVYEGNQDQELQKLVRETVDYSQRRLNLLNQPLALQGKSFEGAAFNPAAYEGKVLLVTFWSAENIQYVQEELPQLKRLREVYQDRGFDIVGVNVDNNRKLVEQFFAFQPVPWLTIMDGSDGMNKLVSQFGVSSIPFNMLVDSKGAVIALHVNSRTLPAKLVELLGGSGGAAPPRAAPDTPPKNSGAALPDPMRELVAHGASHGFAPRGAFWSVAMGLGGLSLLAARIDEPPVDDNPYLAPANLPRRELVDFLLKMQEKPQAIRGRPGFDEALVEAADRVLAERSDDELALVAFEVKAKSLHNQARSDMAGAQERLDAFVHAWKDDDRPRVAAEIIFLQLEGRVLQVDNVPLEGVPGLLDEIQEYLGKAKLSERHLRLASATVHAINRMDIEMREAYFQKFGKLFTSSKDKSLAAYGRNLAATDSAPGQDLVGQPIELSGPTALGVDFDWSSYRGKVVLIDFWATWCGPCRREAPLLKELRERNRDRGFDVVGVNLDKDPEALSKYLDEDELPWANLVGESAQSIARRYDVRAIPMLVLVDKQGNVAAVSHKSSELSAKIESLLK